MSRILICYHGEEGQTDRIATYIGDVIAAEGSTVERARAETNPTPHGFDGVILGDSIHFGRHSKALARWIAAHATVLQAQPTALFQVSLTSADDDEEHRVEADRLLRQLLEPTGLAPEVVGLFGGALAYTNYGWMKRTLMKRLAAAEGRETDTSRDHEYTDWDMVRQFARDAVAAFEGRRPWAAGGAGNS